MNLGISAIQFIDEVKNGSFTVEEFVSKTKEPEPISCVMSVEKPNMKRSFGQPTA